MTMVLPPRTFAATSSALEAQPWTYLQPELPPAPTYGLRKTEVKGIVGDFLREEPGLPDGRLVGIRVDDSNSHMSNAARWLERQVFETTFQNDAQEMGDLYGGVEKDSTWFVVLDRRRKLPVGVMRVVGGESAYKMSLAEAPAHIKMPSYIEDPVQLIKTYHGIKGDEKAWDAATVAVDPRYRGKTNIAGQVAVVGMLERMFVREGMARGIKKVFTMLDVKAYGGLKNVGIPFETMYGPQKAFEFAGSAATLAMVGHFENFQPSVAERHKKLSQESFLKNVLRMGIKKALRRRVDGRVAGMAALGNNVDDHIKLAAA